MVDLYGGVWGYLLDFAEEIEFSSVFVKYDNSGHEDQYYLASWILVMTKILKVDDFELWHSFALFQAAAAETKVSGKSV